MMLLQNLLIALWQQTINSKAADLLIRKYAELYNLFLNLLSNSISYGSKNNR